MTELQLVSVRLGQQGWRVMLGAELGGIAQAIDLGLSGGLSH